MKKVSLLTIHFGANFGSTLQTIATVEMLKRHGCKTRVVDYIPARYTWKRFFRRSLRSVTSVLKLPLLLFVEAANRYIYQSFLSRHVTFSRPIHAEDDFAAVCPKADIYVTGSDQVWNSLHNEGLDKHYYFDGFPDGTRKIAYDASIGSERTEADEYAEEQRK